MNLEAVEECSPCQQEGTEGRSALRWADEPATCQVPHNPLVPSSWWLCRLHIIEGVAISLFIRQPYICACQRHKRGHLSCIGQGANCKKKAYGVCTSKWTFTWLMLTTFTSTIMMSVLGDAAVSHPFLSLNSYVIQSAGRVLRSLALLCNTHQICRVATVRGCLAGTY